MVHLGRLILCLSIHGGPLCGLLLEADIMLKPPKETHYLGYWGMLISYSSPYGGPLCGLLREANIML